MSVVGLDEQMIVLMKLLGIDSPLAGHAEVKDQSIPAVGIDEAEFAAPPKRGDGCARKPLAQIGGKGAAKVRPALLHTGNSSVEQDFLEAADGGFDFWELWHDVDMANLVAAS